MSIATTKNRFLKIGHVTALVLCLSAAASAQRAEQTFGLVAGWNSIFLELDAAPSAADDVFDGLPITSVWMRAAHVVAPFDPNCSGPDDPDCVPAVEIDTQWRVWVPPAGGDAEVTSLRVIRGGHVYLINATQAVQLTIRGRPAGFTTGFRQGPNLTGFYVVDDAQSAPSFASYLLPSDRLRDAEVFAVESNGTVTSVAVNTLITPDRGFWITAKGDTTYGGPVEIDKSALGGINFGKDQLTQPITLRNLAASERTVTVQFASALDPSESDGLPDRAGDVPMFWLDYGSGGEIEEILQWYPLTTHSLAIPADNMETPPTTLEVGVRRKGLAAAILNTEGEGSQYDGIVEITDGVGFSRLIGVSNEVRPQAIVFADGGPADGLPTHPGLYVGIVRVDRVSWVTAGAPIWTNDDAIEPEFAGLMRCFGGGEPPDTGCVPLSGRCTGTAELDMTHIACETVDDCCAVIAETTGNCPDCPSDCPDGGDMSNIECGSFGGCPSGGICRGFCLGDPTIPCTESDQCPDEDGVCSANLNNVDARPTPHPFEFPLIVHLDDFGVFKLLTGVALLKDQEDQLVLRTRDCDPSVCDGSLEGALLVNGEPFALRVTTAAFAFEHDLTLVNDPATVLTQTITIGLDDPLHPFRHSFHPDHDCVNSEGEPSENECPEISRLLIMTFESEPPNGEGGLDWGDSVVGGIYTENVTGLYRESIKAQGRFELRRVSDIGALNAPVDGGTLR